MSLFASLSENPLLQQYGSDLLWIAGIITAITLIAKVPIVNRPFRWVWCTLISDPISHWGRKVVTNAVSPHLGSQDDKLLALQQFINVAQTNQEYSLENQADLKIALQNLHDCIDRRYAENNERIEKLTNYTEEVLTEAVGAKERIRQLYRALEVPVFESDNRGNFTYVNPAYCKITGLTVEESLGEGWTESLHPDDRARVFHAWGSATGGLIDFNSIYRFRNRITGITVEVKASAKPLHDGRGDVVGWVGTLDPVDEE